MPTSVAMTSFTRALFRYGATTKVCVLAGFLGLSVAACSSSGDGYQALQGYQPCHPVDAGNEQALNCESAGRNVLLAMASGERIDRSELVEREVLDDQRGGFISAGGLQLDFGFQFQTIVNGTPQLSTYLSYNDLLAGGGGIPVSNSIALGGGDLGTTQIIHSGGPGGIGTSILTSQSGLDVHHVSTLAIDIIGLSRVHRGGRALNGGGHMPMELKQAIVRTLQ